MMALRSLHEEGWIDLSRTDTMDTELTAAPDEIRTGLLESSAEYVEVLGPLVFNHSRLDHAVVGNDDDRDLLERVFGTVHPDVEITAARRQHKRDAMHIATTIRYGLNGFITNDRQLLSRADAVKTAFDGFLILSPGAALAISQRQVNKARRRENKKGGT